MPKAWLAFYLSACAITAHAEEVTRAWHRVAAPEAVRKAATIPKAPSPSVFTSEGDQLVDLSKALKAEGTFGKGAWIVWNETRHLLVIHGDRHTLACADQASIFRQDHLAGVTLAWYRGIDPGEPLPANAKPVHRTEIITKSIHDERKWEPADAGPLGEIELDVEVILLPDSSYADVHLGIDWKEKRDGGLSALSWYYGGGFVPHCQEESERVIFQAVSPTNERWTVTAKVRDLLLDGTLASESRWQEVAGEPVPVMYRAPETEAKPLGQAVVEGRTLHVADFVSDGFFVATVFDAFERDHPKAVGRGRARGERPAYCKEAVLPDELKAYAVMPMWDLKPLVKDYMYLAETDWIAYDPQLKRVLVASEDPGSPDGIALSANASCGRDHPDFAATFRGNASGSPDHPMAVGAKLIGRFGAGAHLECWDERETSLLFIRASPNEGPLWGLIDTRYELGFDGFRDFPTLKGEGEAVLVPGLKAPVQTNESEGRETTVSAELEVGPSIRGSEP